MPVFELIAEIPLCLTLRLRSATWAIVVTYPLMIGAVASGSEWGEQAVLTSPFPTPGGSFGDTFDIEGGTLVIGEPSRLSLDYTGSIHFYQRQANGSWRYNETLNAPSDDEMHSFGSSLDLDGDTLTVGVPGRRHSLPHQVMFYDVVESAPGPSTGTLFGERKFGINLDRENDVLVVGTDPYGGNGHVQIHEYKPFTGLPPEFLFWQQEAIYQNPGGASHSATFGHTFDLQADTLVIAAPGTLGTDTNPGPWGKAYVVTRQTDGTWSDTVQIDRSGQERADLFGWSLVLQGDLLLVGSPGSDVLGEDTGSVSVFERNAFGEWLEVDRIFPADPQPGLEFGSSIAVSGNRMVVGGKGVAFVLELNDGQWIETATLLPSNEADTLGFGGLVAIADDTILVRGKLPNIRNVDVGRVYLFGPIELLVGDADGDGDVDAFDLAVWQTEFGQKGAHLSADFDEDSDVDAFDLGIWQTNFGTGVGAEVPEPATLALIAGLGLLASSRSARRTGAEARSRPSR